MGVEPRVIRRVYLMGGFAALQQKFTAQLQQMGVEVGGSLIVHKGRLSAAGTWSSYDALMIFVDIACHAMSAEASVVAKRNGIPIFKIFQSWLRTYEILSKDPLWVTPLPMLSAQEVLHKELVMKQMSKEKFYEDHVKPIFEPGLKNQRILAYKQLCGEIHASLPKDFLMGLEEVVGLFTIADYRNKLNEFYSQPAKPLTAQVPYLEKAPNRELLSEVEALEKEFEMAVELLLTEHPNLLLTDISNQVAATLAFMGSHSPVLEWEDFYFETWEDLKKTWKNRNPLKLWEDISSTLPKPKEFLWDHGNKVKVFTKITGTGVFETFVAPNLAKPDQEVTNMKLSVNDKRGLIWYETWKTQRVSTPELARLWDQHGLMVGCPLDNDYRMRNLMTKITDQLQLSGFVFEKYGRDRPQYQHTTYSLRQIPPQFKAAWEKIRPQIGEVSSTPTEDSMTIMKTAPQMPAPQMPTDNLGVTMILKKEVPPMVPTFELTLKEGIKGHIFESGLLLKEALNFPPELSLLGDGSGGLIYRPAGGILSLIPSSEGLEIKGDRLFLTKDNANVRKLVRSMSSLGLEAPAILAACQASQYTFMGQSMTLEIVAELLSA